LLNNPLFNKFLGPSGNPFRTPFHNLFNRLISSVR